MNLINSISITRELSDCASKKHNRQLSVVDIRFMRKRRSRSESRSDAVKVRDMLEAHGAVQIGLDGDVDRHVFFSALSHLQRVVEAINSRRCYGKNVPRVCRLQVYIRWW